MASRFAPGLVIGLPELTLSVPKWGCIQIDSLSWCDQKETGLCDQKENNDLSPLPQESGLIISPVASAEDRALRGRNLSAG